VRILLIRKLAMAIDGIDLSNFKVGDVMLLPEKDGWMLIAEGWAELVLDSTTPQRDAFPDV